MYMYNYVEYIVHDYIVHVHVHQFKWKKKNVCFIKWYIHVHVPVHMYSFKKVFKKHRYHLITCTLHIIDIAL